PGHLLDRGDLPHDDTADVVADRLDGLHLKAGRGEPPGHLRGRNRLIYRGVLAQPGQWDAHQTSTPSPRLNRTSPSRASLMSVSTCRTMSVRSMPSPNAKPLYRSGSIPHAISTLGLTIPAPASSTQPCDRHNRHGSPPGRVEAPRQT